MTKVATLDPILKQELKTDEMSNLIKYDENTAKLSV